MGEAKRRKQAMKNSPSWAYYPGYEYSPVTGLTLSEALNFGDYYTREQAIEAIANKKMPWEINRMRVSDKIYKSVESLCLRTGYLNIGHFDIGSCIKWSPNLMDRQG